jgi:uncharacterized LabA/DUF88 family protein
MRTAVYVDGFNLFHSLLDGKSGRKWLDLHAMARAVLQPNNQVCKIRYFTARVTAPPNDPDMPSRQDVYLRALRAQGVIIHLGMFKERPKTRRLVNPPRPPASKYVEVWHREEKGSDVNLAVHMLHDAWSGVYDCAVVVSNDSDLAEACHLVKSMGKVVGLLSPAHRPTQELQQCTDFYRRITATHLTNSQLPDPVIDTSTGREIRCPPRWK